MTEATPAQISTSASSAPAGYYPPSPPPLVEHNGGMRKAEKKERTKERRAKYIADRILHRVHRDWQRTEREGCVYAHAHNNSNV